MVKSGFERKRNLVWTWILGFLALAAVVVGVSTWLHPGDVALGEQRPAQGATPPVAAPQAGLARTPAVQSYLLFVEQPPAEPGVQHEYTSEGVRRLTAALDALTVNDVQSRGAFESFRQKAERLQASDQRSLQHTNAARDVFTSAADVLARVQASRAPGLEGPIDQACATAESIRVEQPLPEQDERVKRFFAQMSDALRGLTREASPQPQ